jgi:hypothetical protein
MYLNANSICFASLNSYCHLGAIRKVAIITTDPSKLRIENNLLIVTIAVADGIFNGHKEDRFCYKSNKEINSGMMNSGIIFRKDDVNSQCTGRPRPGFSSTDRDNRPHFTSLHFTSLHVASLHVML